MPGTASTFDAALFAFQQGDPHARETLPTNKSFKKKLLNLARQEAGDLSSDLLDDVVQRTWELLLRPNLKHFDPNRGTANAYLKQVTKRAATDVRAEYTPPGQRTRVYKDNVGEIVSQIPSLSLDAELQNSAEEVFTLHDIIPNSTDLFDAFLIKNEVEQLLELARTTGSNEIHQALNLIYYQDINLTQSAQAVELHRSTLRRHLDRWVSFHQLALAV